MRYMLSAARHLERTAGEGGSDRPVAVQPPAEARPFETGALGARHAPGAAGLFPMTPCRAHGLSGSPWTKSSTR